jgi:hypothetical protein
MTPTAPPISATAEQQYQNNNNKDQFHSKPPLRYRLQMGGTACHGLSSVPRRWRGKQQVCWRTNRHSHLMLQTTNPGLFQSAAFIKAISQRKKTAAELEEIVKQRIGAGGFRVTVHRGQGQCALEKTCLRLRQHCAERSGADEPYLSEGSNHPETSR